MQPRDAHSQRRKTAADKWIGVSALRDRDRTALGEWIAKHVAQGDNLVVGRLPWGLSETAVRRRRDGDCRAVTHG